jgi:low-affinity ferrous iron transport protein
MKTIMFKRMFETLRQPGVKGAIQGFAPTQRVSKDLEQADSSDVEGQANGFWVTEKSRVLDRWLDGIVRASGSEIVFFSVLTGLAVWALLGIRFGRNETWQVIISDIQAILSYAFDSLLMRQQTNMYDREILVAVQMQSRIKSHVRMLSKLSGELSSQEKTDIVNICERADPVEGQDDDNMLPSEGKFGQFITAVSHAIGHLIPVGLFWVGVVVWIGIGPLFDWSDMWQLYMNSASSALMVLYFAFLANVRERHSYHAKRCLDTLFNTDSTLELRLRDLTGDLENNPLVIIPPPKVGRLQRVIFYYAEFVSTLVGIAILLTVMIAWVATGPVFRFSSNWWLFIGTYAGLVGMNDGFVLRNMQSRLSLYVEKEMSIVEQEDQKIFQFLGLSAAPNPAIISEERKPSTSEYASLIVEKVSAHELTVAAGFLTIIGLLVGASAMKWSLTGQLLCNVPPSLIESFFMMILVTGHNLNDDKKRVQLQVLYERRWRLLRYVDLVKKLRTQSIPTFDGKKADIESTVGRE